ncbi:MAG TPA: nucleotide sugar dehydrogenase [Vicinamibacterales bacterium]|jgi:UDP-N-acetyl-D-glucosamine dehydrogenase|nr:nucleotide sugar dehydrogenase [Vicinamibacterales bacterium]
MVRSAAAKSLLELIRSRRAKTGVIGLGYVGLPLAVEFGRAGYTAIGVDLDSRKVNAINEGRSYIDDVPTAHVAELKAANRLRATTDFDVLAEVDTINICVPTPLRKTKDPDMSYIVNSAEEIAKRIRPGQLIILESTTYPGTTDELVLPMLERGGLKGGKDFFLAFSPERVDPSNRSFNTHNIPKVIGGLTEDCTAVASALYDGAIKTIVPVSSPRVAEMVKLLENTFRAVNIGMVNELALMCDRMGIDVWEVVKAASTKPFGFMAFYPGPGLGGHCIPVDPFYLSWKARESGFEARFIELAGAVNANMPHYVVSLMSEALNGVRKPLNGSKVLVAGIAYKKDVDDIRESPALDLLHLLRERGAELSYTDPFVPKLPAKEWPNGIDLVNVDTSTAASEEYDCVVVVTDHSQFDYDQLQRVAKVVVDTRNAIKSPGPKVVRLGAARKSPAPELASAH